MLDHIRLTVQGKVQGVSFRFYTERKALELNLKGTVKNLTNGNVEIFVSGEEHFLNQFIDWCRMGPPSSHVTNLEIEKLEFGQKFDTFKIIF